MGSLHKLKKIFSFISIYRMHLLIILIISFSGMFFELLQPKLLGDIIDHIGNNMFGDIGIIVVLMCLAELVSSLLTYLSTFLMTKVGINVSTELKTKFYNNMIELPSYKLDAMQSGNLLTRYETDINNLSDFLSSYLVSFIMNFFSFLIILYFSFSINIILTCIVIIFLPISLYVERLFSGKLKKNIRELRCMNDEYLTLFTETIKGNSDIKLLRAEKFFIYKMEKFQIFYKDSVTKLNLTRNLGSFIKKSIFVFLELVMLFVGIKYIKFGVLTIGNFIAFSNYSARLNNSISQIIRVYGSFNETTVSIERIEEVNNSFIHFDKNNDKEDNKKVDSSIFKEIIVFKDVSFEYNKNNPVFNNLNIIFKPTLLNIILGDSGLGKSTLFKLIVKLYEPQSGSIYFGGTNIKDISSSIIRRNVAYVPQSPYFFNVSIKENMKYANADITIDEIYHILKMVNLYEFILTLPCGIDTIMKEAGSNLSEGQKQRLNIARAIAQKPQIFLFDEPTSALDVENRSEILQIIQNLSTRNTVIMITHDREIIGEFDKANIVEIDNLIQRPS